MSPISTLAVVAVGLVLCVSRPAVADVSEAEARPAINAGAVPVERERFGVSLNPFMLGQTLVHDLVSGGPERSGYPLYLTATFSASALDSRTEIAVPIALIDFEAPEDDAVESNFSLRRIDLQLRRFSRNDRMGLYAGPLVRLARIEGQSFASTGSPFTFSVGAGESVPTGRLAYTRYGAGFVVGRRRTVDLDGSDRQLFYGVNLHVGWWLNDAPEPLRYDWGPHEDREKMFYNVEFAKVGLRF